jgi:hypothetical protein
MANSKPIIVTGKNNLRGTIEPAIHKANLLCFNRDQTRGLVNRM